MKNGVSAIQDIRAYINKLKKNIQESENYNQKLNEKNNILLEEKKVLKLEVDTLNEQIKMLKLAKQIDGTGVENAKDVKLMINEMVREIDKCIALMNK